MVEEELSKQLLRDWVRRRIAAVQDKYSAYDALLELGVEGIVDQDTPVSVFCPFHPNTNTPAARYYPASGRNEGYLRCFACKENWRAINIFAKARGKRFMDALVELERRYRINIPKRPELPEYVDPIDRKSDYQSEQWADIHRVIPILESRLIRLRGRVHMPEFVRFCRVIDAVSYDFERTGKSTPEMTNILRKLMGKMEDAVAIADMEDPTQLDDTIQRV